MEGKPNTINLKLYHVTFYSSSQDERGDATNFAKWCLSYTWRQTLKSNSPAARKSIHSPSRW
ncbi:hypothetical protein BJD43_gp183 [Cyanophage S-RIM50]|uniref:Uncharacterized protein n=1 Tax=Cyanophage S-RIM50 TaxID=687803 RepID=A0A127KLC4_9CAUD|nr:hypothetical protein BJD43_gp183 [Cyanophage S-RIM50]AMO42847.1 hypothetical protein R290704_065 [Cyanophage S-RIM50]